MGEVSDEELTEQALAADPDAPIPDDAVPFGRRDADPLLPEWYMPAPARVSRTRTSRVAVGLIVATLVVLNGLGLCVTYGIVEVAW